MREMITERFFGRVDVEYVDLDDDQVTNYDSISEIIDDPSVPLPIVTINGKTVNTGPIYFPAIFDELEKLIS